MSKDNLTPEQEEAVEFLLSDGMTAEEIILGIAFAKFGIETQEQLNEIWNRYDGDYEAILTFLNKKQN